MPLKFRKDPDLDVLALTSHKDLERLARVLTVDEKDGANRHAQQLLDDPLYRQALKDQDLAIAWRSIAAELQSWGGDSVANAVRNLFKDHGGVFYREIVNDLCAHLKLKVTPQEDIKELEDQLLAELIHGQKDRFTAEDMARILNETARGIGLQESLGTKQSFEELVKRSASDPKLAYVLAAAAPAIASVALPFLARLSSATVGAIVAPRVGTAIMPATAPLALAAALIRLSSPAYRVTLPAVLEVIRIRRAVLMKRQLDALDDGSSTVRPPESARSEETTA